MTKFDINLFSYLPKSIQAQDKDGEMKKFTQAIDLALSEMADVSLQTSWDIENVDIDELRTIALSLGLHPQPYMSEDVLRKYIRSFGTINRLKGTDTLITYLVERLTHFKVLEVSVDEENNRLIRTKVMRDIKLQEETEERILDFLIPKYTKLLYTYLVTYVNYSQTVWSNILSHETRTISRSFTDLVNFLPMRRIEGQPFELVPYGNEQVPELLNISSVTQMTTESVIELISDISSSVIQTALRATSINYYEPNIETFRKLVYRSFSYIDNFGTSGDIIEMGETNVYKHFGQIESSFSSFPSISFKQPFELQTL